MIRQGGFTLMEIVLVIVIISVASIPLFNLFSQAATSLISNESIQTATQLAQERAEFILSTRRSQGYAAAPLAAGTVTENLPIPYDIYTRDTAISEPTAPAPPPSGCPAGALCKQVDINVTQAGQSLARVSFLLVNY